MAHNFFFEERSRYTCIDEPKNNKREWEVSPLIST